MIRLADSLAADIRPLPDRLAGIFRCLTGAIEDAERDGYLSDELLTRMQDVRYRLIHVDGSGDVAHLVTTLAAMTQGEAYEIATELVELTRDVRFSRLA